MAPTLNLIGAGQVGRALGRLGTRSGVWTVQDVLTRGLPSARAAVEFIGAGRPVARMAELRAADLVLLAVGDDQIAPACAALAAARPLAGVVVFHCSGARASGELAAARAAGAAVASVHPIRSFADPAQVAASFEGTWCGIEGDAAALARLEPALAALGAQAVRIDAQRKTVYHAAAVFASNYLVTVLDAAVRAFQAAGMAEPQARALAAPLARETLDNVLRLGGPAALTGPVARGDSATVARQQAALQAWDAPTGALYAALAQATGAVAARKRRAE